MEFMIAIVGLLGIGMIVGCVITSMPRRPDIDDKMIKQLYEWVSQDVQEHFEKIEREKEWK